MEITMNAELRSRIEKARVKMMLALPFIAGAVLMLDLVEDKTVETAETDGNSIFYNPAFLNDLTIPQLMWLLAHEALHCVLLHHTRIGLRHFKLWNIAADYVINLILHGISQFEFIEGCLLDFKYLDLSTEEVYNLLNQLTESGKQQLMDNHSDAGGFRKAGSGEAAKGKPDKETLPSGAGETQPSDQVNSGEGSKAGDGEKTIPKKSGHGSDLSSQEEKWQIFAKQSKDVVAKFGGEHEGIGSAFLKRLIDKIINPVVPWHQLLYSFVDKIVRDEYDWNRPNSRYVSYGYYFPSLYSEQLGFLVVMVDTSGSINADDLNRFAAEINGIREAYQCKILVIYVDAIIKGHQVFEPYEPIDLSPHGGGGTNFRPGFEYVDREGLAGEVSCCIYFTDGICSKYPEVPPVYPVLWVGMREFKPQFGDFVMMESI